MNLCDHTQLKHISPIRVANPRHGGGKSLALPSRWIGVFRALLVQSLHSRTSHSAQLNPHSFAVENAKSAFGRLGCEADG